MSKGGRTSTLHWSFASDVTDEDYNELKASYNGLHSSHEGAQAVVFSGSQAVVLQNVCHLAQNISIVASNRTDAYVLSPNLQLAATIPLAS